MSKFLALLLLFEISELLSGQGYNMLGPGIWSLISISKCPNENELEEIKAAVEVVKHKLNRTHEGINANISCTDELNDNFAVYIEVCKHVDGGCKPYHILSDDSMPRFFKKYTKENMEKALRMANIDPPDFPIPKGYYAVKNYIVDFCDMPRDGVYGKFEALVYMIYKKKKVGCVKLVARFNKFEEENYCDE